MALLGGTTRWPLGRYWAALLGGNYVVLLGGHRVALLGVAIGRHCCCLALVVLEIVEVRMSWNAGMGRACNCMNIL